LLEWLNTIVQGVLLGGLYALFALGLSLIYGVMRLVNLAHGDFIVLAAYVALSIIAATGMHPFASIPIVAALAFGAGYVVQRGVLNRTLGHDILPPLLVTFGFSIVIQNALLEIYSADNRSLKAGDLEIASVALGPITVGWFPLIVFFVSLAITAAMGVLFARTSLGRAFRATSDDPDTAKLMGIDDRHVYGLAMGLAVAIVAVAGVFLGIRSGFTPSVGPEYLLYAFEAVVIGGLGSFWGTFSGGLILGVAQAIGFKLDPGWGIIAGHLVFLAVLLARPTGLFPKTR
jgi:branched-chain amino acid transport system permease protein